MEKEWPAKGGPEDVSRLRQEASDAETAPERLIELSADSELRLLVAANVSTSAAHLEELSKDESEQVRRVVAQNPNVSLSCLLALASEFPAEFFLNPLHADRGSDLAFFAEMRADPAFLVERGRRAEKAQEAQREI
jgi:hypothetical protein